jgi:hypothetical protein
MIDAFTVTVDLTFDRAPSGACWSSASGTSRVEVVDHEPGIAPDRRVLEPGIGAVDFAAEDDVPVVIGEEELLAVLLRVPRAAPPRRRRAPRPDRTGKRSPHADDRRRDRGCRAWVRAGGPADARRLDAARGAIGRGRLIFGGAEPASGRGSGAFKRIVRYRPQSSVPDSVTTSPSAKRVPQLIRCSSRASGPSPSTSASLSPFGCRHSRIASTIFAASRNRSIERRSPGRPLHRSGRSVRSERGT